MTEQKLFADYQGFANAGLQSEALATLQKATAQFPRFAKAWYHLSGMYQRAGRLNDALAAVTNACEIEPGNADHWMLASNMRQDNGELELALACADNAIKYRANHAPTLNNKGIILADLGRLESAVAVFQQAISIDANYARAYSNLGSALLRLQRSAEALPLLKRAIAINPAYAHAHANLGSVQFELGQFAEAEASLRESVRLNPAQTSAFTMLSKLYREQHDLDKAESAIREAIQRKPGSAKERNQLGDILVEKGIYGEAVQSFQAALALQPNNLSANIRSALLLPSLYDDAADVDQKRARFTAGMENICSRVAEFSQNPREELIAEIQFNNFFLAYQGKNDLSLQLKFAQLIESILRPLLPQLYQPIVRQSTAGRRIRVGFASRALYNCTVGNYFSSWILDLDRGKFEVFFYHNNRVSDDVTQRIAAASDHFLHTIIPMPVLAQRIKEDELDVLVYPELGMDPIMFAMASLRLAAVQCCGWGHPVTTGHSNIDHFISCELMEPPNALQHYSEKLVLLPGMGTRYAVPSAPLKSASKQRGDYQLPADKTLYFYPQSLFKIHPDNDDLVVDVLANDLNGVLVMFAGSYPLIAQAFVERLSRAFARRGMSTQGRVKILPNLSHDDYKRVNQLCDLMLDTLYWSGGNTSLDALNAGLPIVTLPGEFMRGRQSAGMLMALGVPELIAHNRADYIAIATKLGADIAYRQQFTRRIKASRLNLFDDSRPTTALQDFFANGVSG